MTDYYSETTGCRPGFLFGPFEKNSRTEKLKPQENNSKLKQKKPQGFGNV